MDSYQKQRCIELMLYVLTKTGGTDSYHLMKILYFAQQKHLADWGTKMFQDDIYALQYGPVPSMLYDLIKGKIDDEFNKLFTDNISSAGDDAPNVLFANRKPNMEYLSVADIDVLDASIIDNANLSFNQLLDKSHKEAWAEAFNRPEGAKIISPIAMAKEYGATQEMLDYIADELETEELLSVCN